jgi:fibro-slime domain-containing protein
MNAGGTGMVKDALENGIPAAKSPGVCKNVADWFTDSAENSKHVAEVILYDNGNGGYVNRWGANGEQWEGPPAADIICGYSGPAADNCGGCSSYDPDIHECYINGTNEAGEASPQGCGATSCVAKITRDYHDGNPFFFPVDGIDGALDNGGSVARVGPAGPGYWKANGTYPTEAQALGLSEPVLRNFHFTTEITYWFPYAANTNAKLEFSGDDDVWVFLNGKLAVDIGGLHEPLDGSVTIDSTTAANYGLSAGNVYEIKVFHAERQTDGSTFKLTLSGFDATRSDCEATCGDGIIGFGEECDDGQNNGGYNQCNAECTLGAYCGDGIQQENEDCDDADPNSGGNCRNCRNLILR